MGYGSVALGDALLPSSLLDLISSTTALGVDVSRGGSGDIGR